MFLARRVAGAQPAVLVRSSPLVTAATRPVVQTIAAAQPAEERSGALAKTRLYWRLSKGHLSTWVAISAFPGYLVSVPWPVDPTIVAALAFGTAATSASAQTMNQLIETRRDALMTRTRMRPLPTGQLSATEAKTFAISAFVAGTAALSFGCGSPMAAAIAGSTALLYAGVYTPMKVVSGYNTHVGAVVGSLPVLIGYAAAGVSMTSLAPWTLFAIQTIWQFPHFYALAWLHKDDYKRGGYSMFPMNDISGQQTVRMCLPYMAALAVVPGISAALGATSWMFAISGLVPLAVWTKIGFLPFKTAPSKETARNFFLHSLWYILVMYGAFTIHATETSEHDARMVLKEKLGSFCLHDLLVKDFWTPAALCPLPSSSESNVRVASTSEQN
jgi:protoheme IX farnesyltransferase